MKFKIVYIWGNTSRNPYHQHILFCSYKAAEKHLSKAISHFTSQVFCSEKAAEKSFIRNKKFECKSIDHYNQILKAAEFDHWYEIHKVVG
jgi:hypothetical protein